MGNSDLNEHKTSLCGPRSLGEWPRLIKSQEGILLTPMDWAICEQAGTLEAGSEKAVQHNENWSIS